MKSFALFHHFKSSRCIRRIAILCLLLSLASAIFAAGPVANGNKGFEIMARKGISLELSVTPITAGTDSGMDFDLEGDDVRTAQGRAVALWSIASNHSSINVEISASDLTFVNTASTSINAKIPYLLLFDSTYTTGSGGMVADQFYIKSTSYSGSSSNLARVDNKYTISCDSDESINFMNNQIRFILPNDVDISSDRDYPVGDYSATISITVEAGA